MTPSQKTAILIFGFASILCCLIGLGGLFLTGWFASPAQSTPPPLIFPTRPPAVGLTALPTPSIAPPSLVVSGPQGKIVYVCQIFKLQAQDQICLINADGTGQRRLTTEDTARHYYPSFAPDGQSVLFSSNLDGNFKIYEQTLTGQPEKIGDTVGIAPEVSPDNRLIAFTRSDGKKDFIWVMERDGSQPRPVVAGRNPTWSPDGSRILFATMLEGKPQLASVNLEGSDFRQLTDLPDLRGRSDWSPDGLQIITYSGKPWQRELFLMQADGSDVRQLTQPGGNSQGPSFSPNGEMVAFTAYFDAYQNHNGCEIYSLRVDGGGLTRLTNNNYCDWQPRWGP